MEINPKRNEHGDPLCSRDECPQFSCSTFEQYDPSTCRVTGKVPGDACVPGWRAEVARLTAEVVTMREYITMARVCLDAGNHWRTEQAENQAMRHIDAALAGEKKEE